MAKLDDEELVDLWTLLLEPQKSTESRRAVERKVVSFDQKADVPAQITVMSALDDLVACFAIGGQVKHYYRYGSYDTCGMQRAKFWFAIRNGLLTDHHKAVPEMSDSQLAQYARVQDFFRHHSLAKLKQGSSEDVWEARRELLVNPFQPKL